MSSSERIKELKIDSTLWTDPRRILNLLDFDPKKIINTPVLLLIHQY